MNKDGFEYFEGKIGEIYSYWYCGVYNWSYIIDFININIFKQCRTEVKNVLDCACGGCGEPSISLAKKGFNVCCSDGSSKMLKSAKKRINELNIEVELIQFPLFWQNLKKHFGDRKFDAILCLSNSISHVHPDELNSVFDNMLGLLNKGGILVLDTKRYSEDGRELHYEKDQGLVERSKINHGKRIIENNDKVATISTEVLYYNNEPQKETIKVTVEYNDGEKWIEDCNFWKYSKDDIIKSIINSGVKKQNINISNQPLPEMWKYEVIFVIK